MPQTPVAESAEEQNVVDHQSVHAAVIFEAIRREGEYELSRPFSALWWSGVAAGLAISTSVLCKGFLLSILPDTEWAAGISNLGYAVGFLIVVLGRMQLFTENTLTPILPFFLSPTLGKLGQIARLWGIVFTANLAGCALAAAVLVHGNILPPRRLEGILAVSRHFAEATPMEHFGWGIPAGFIIAALVWILPRMESAGEVLIIVILTYTIGLGGMSHVIAGSTEIFIVSALGEIGLGTAMVGVILPTLAGNVLGGTGIFATLTFAQVRKEI